MAAMDCNSFSLTTNEAIGYSMVIVAVLILVLFSVIFLTIAASYLFFMIPISVGAGILGTVGFF